MHWDKLELLKLSEQHWTYAAISTGLELNIFSHLEKACSISELAKLCQCKERSFEMLIIALINLKLIYLENELLHLTDFAKENLCKNSKAYMGHIISHSFHLAPAWASLAECVKNDTPARTSVMTTKNDEERESFLLGMDVIAKVQANAILEHIDLKDRKKLLDLGGASGTYAINFCLHNPQLEATIFDLPHSETFASQNIKNYNLSHRINFVGGDYFTSELPTDCDVAWLSQILHGHDKESAAQLVKNAVDCLKADGKILIQEFILETGKATYPALFNLNMLVATPRGQSYTQNDIFEFLDKAGAKNIQRLQLDLPNGIGIISANA